MIEKCLENIVFNVKIGGDENAIFHINKYEFFERIKINMSCHHKKKKKRVVGVFGRNC